MEEAIFNPPKTLIHGHLITPFTQHAKGTEVFVGGLPSTISEDIISKVFSGCGEIVEIRMIKDQKGNLKGFCFVRFATKEAADKAVKEKSGIVVDGKKIGVLPSIQQDTLYFGNLNKGWSADEFEKLVLQVFPDVVSVDLAMLKDMPPGQKQRNRGFAFVKFSSHAAAARALRVGSQSDFRLGGKLHPAVQWAEEECEVDQTELAKIKIAFVRNLPTDADENYLKQLFEHFGKVDKVAVSRKSASPVGFIHFTERSDLERAINEMNEKTIQGPNGGPFLKLQVEVARPTGRNKKRVHEDSHSSPSIVLGHSKHLKEEISASPSINHKSNVQKELEYADPYEAAVVSLPLSVKERLLRILRLGIATRFDIDIQNLSSLKQIPESAAISVLDQFMLSGAGLQNKGAYLAGLVSKHLVDKAGRSENFASLSRVVDVTAKGPKLLSFSSQLSVPAVDSFASNVRPVARSGIYMPRYSLSDYPLSSRATVEKEEVRGSDFILSGGATARRMVESGISPFEATPTSSYGRFGLGLRGDNTHLSPPQPAPVTSRTYSRVGVNLSSGITADTDRQTTRSQVRFDPFTGEPYKFDPFTGEPIRQEFDPFTGEPVRQEAIRRPPF
ncbi:putative RNA-binding protein 46 [Forsythia ovata]|uniref:RNA-binding protein 46 n=1 Tax=Forsythia ovata TaxID=205694 RepID=A0ABD1UDD3_9LAMI